MVSMKDVAAACGVSVATVSKALSNHRDIGERTRKLVKETAEQRDTPKQSAMIFERQIEATILAYCSRMQPGSLV